MSEIIFLIEKLNEASRAYYAGEAPIMSDFEWDNLFSKLSQLEKETGEIHKNSPTQSVGFEIISGLEKMAHDRPMLSLDKTKSFDELSEFLGDHLGVLSWKLDGLSISLTYENGKLLSAITRGNGTVGEDITHNAKVFKNIKKTIDFKGRLNLRGEALISYSDFDEINKLLADTEKYKNPRNLTSGTVRQLNSEIVSKRNVRFICCSAFAEGLDFENSKAKALEFVNNLGIDVCEHVVLDKMTLKDSFDHFASKVDSYDFATDGLVLTFDDISFSENLGATSKFPKDSLAFKWADETAETTLEKVVWSTSRTGLINPVAVFAPVDLEGTTVRRASLHNLSILKELELGIGDTITVYKANMIIPQIAENMTKSGNLYIPKTCAVCDTPSKIVEENGVSFLYCTNIFCKAQISRGLAHFSSRNAMNIDGFSESTIEKFLELGIIENFYDIYTLNLHKEKIVSLEGFGIKSYENLVNSIEISKNVSLFSFIYALGIPNVGYRNAKLLCKHFDCDIMKIMYAEFEEIMAVHGFGDVIAKSVVDYFENHENKRLVEKMIEILTFTKNLETTNILSGETFVITGELTEFENRQALQAYIENLGAKATSSVTKKTTYLINNDLKSKSSKNKKAQELGVPIITEHQFLELVSLKNI